MDLSFSVLLCSSFEFIYSVDAFNRDDRCYYSLSQNFLLDVAKMVAPKAIETMTKNKQNLSQAQYNHEENVNDSQEKIC
jgi:hypothetical protein